MTYRRVGRSSKANSRPRRGSGRDAAGGLEVVLRGVGLSPQREFRCVPERRWRFDLAFPGAMVAVEVHGAIWTHGRHTRGAGFQNDREKMNAAQLRGWTVLEYTTDDLAKRMASVVDEILHAVGREERPAITSRKGEE